MPVVRGAGSPGVVVATSAVAGLLLAGCGTSASSAQRGTCPVVPGGQNTLTVRMDGGAGTQVARAQLCTEEGCAPAAYGRADEPPGLGIVTAQRRDARTWTFTLDGAPPRLTVRTFDADGGPLGEAPVTPPWQRVGGGTEECGPQAAEVAFSGG